MSTRLKQFGSVGGEFSQDARIYITGPGKKQALAIIASYQISNIVLPNSVLFADSAVVWGRLTIFDGLVDFGQEYTALTPVTSRVLFDAALPSPGPHHFLLPIADLVPNPSSSNTLSIFLSNIAAQGGVSVQTILVVGGAGTFTITYNGLTTAPIAWNAAAAVVLAALNALGTIIVAGGVASVILTVPAAGMSLYTITFNTGPQNALFSLGAGGATSTSNTVTYGGPPIQWAPLLTVYGRIIDSGNVLSVR